MRIQCVALVLGTVLAFGFSVHSVVAQDEQECRTIADYGTQALNDQYGGDVSRVHDFEGDEMERFSSLSLLKWPEYPDYIIVFNSESHRKMAVAAFRNGCEFAHGYLDPEDYNEIMVVMNLSHRKAEVPDENSMYPLSR